MRQTNETFKRAPKVKPAPPEQPELPILRPVPTAGVQVTAKPRRSKARKLPIVAPVMVKAGVQPSAKRRRRTKAS